MYSLIEEYNKCFSTECKTISGILTDVFNMGMTYGLLKAEEERESEAAFDGAICYLTDEKFQSPSIPTKKRQPHQKKWFEKSHKEANRFWNGIFKFKEPEQYTLF
ncbi:hypothetical protein R4Q14_03215 [Brachyspira intermedia]|uniref:hypothetical protein n=1 Tax=Brachyspira intermedia TaxID=84377 RepID=UPI003006DB38